MLYFLFTALLKPWYVPCLFDNGFGIWVTPCIRLKPVGIAVALPTGVCDDSCYCYPRRWLPIQDIEVMGSREFLCRDLTTREIEDNKYIDLLNSRLQ